MENKKPISTLKHGVYSVAVWENKIDKDGEQIVVNSVSIQRSYKKKKEDEKWSSQQLTNISVRDLPRLILLLSEIYRTQTLKLKTE